MKIDENDLDKKIKQAGKEPAKIKEDLKKHLEKEIQTGARLDLIYITEMSGLAPTNATALTQLMWDQIEVKEGEKPKGKFNVFTTSLEQLTLGEREFDKTIGSYIIRPDPEYTFRFLHLSDTHFGSLHDNVEGVQRAFEHAKSLGAYFATHSGDLVDGNYAHRDMPLYLRPNCHFNDGQKDYVVENWPDLLPTYLIGGNHDHFFWIQAGVDICRQIALERKDMRYLKDETIAESLARKGVDEKDLAEIVKNKKLGSGRVGVLKIGPSHIKPEDRKTHFMMLHPGNGSARTLSYKPQQIAERIQLLLNSFESMENDQGKRIKPHMLGIGHYHKADISLLRNIYIFQAGCMKLADQFHEVKNLDNMMGYWLFELSTKKNGDIVSMKSRFEIPYVNQNRYTRRPVEMRE